MAELTVKNLITVCLYRLRIVLIALLLWIVLPSMEHPFYIGITEVEFKQNSKSIQISIKLFVDDVMSEINSKSNEKFIPEKKNSPVNNRLLVDFVQDDFFIKTANDQRKLITAHKLPIHFIGWELEEGAIWMYWESNNLLQRCVEVNNSLLCNSIKQQIHIVKIIQSQSVKSERISCSSPVFFYCR
jgi:hypothetical protein